MKFTEEKSVSNEYKKRYLQGILDLANSKNEEAKKSRDEYIYDIFKNPSVHRENFKKMLGWPLTEKRPATLPEAELTHLTDEDGVSVYRVVFKTFPGVDFAGILYKKKDDKTRPLVLCQHGGDGSPELAGGFYNGTSNYNDMIERVLKYDVNVFAPQLLLWGPSATGEETIEYNRQSIDGALKRVGSSITAVEIYSYMRAIDWLETQEWVKNFGMVGLSYGGFYTLFMTAIDERIKSAISCSFFSQRHAYSWADWTWQNAGFTYSDAEIACLCYPRHITIQMGDKDELFKKEHTQNEFERLKKLSREVGEDWLDTLIFDGTHEFYKGDEYIEKLIFDLEK